MKKIISPELGVLKRDEHYRIANAGSNPAFISNYTKFVDVNRKKNNLN